MPQIGPALQMVGAWAGKNALGKFILKTLAFTAFSQFSAKKMGASFQSLAHELEPEISSMPERRIIYGETRVSGTMVYMRTTPVYTIAVDTGSRVLQGWQDDDDDFLHLVMEIAGHPCESIDEVYLDDESLGIANYTGGNFADILTTKLYPIINANDHQGKVRTKCTNTDYQSHVMLKLYEGDQTLADADLIDAASLITTSSERWTSDMVGNDKTYAYLRFAFDPGLFPGVPPVAFDVKGKKDIYDPRSGGSTGYSSNPALCLADYLTTPWEEGGLGDTWDQIDETALIAAANDCDTLVDIYDDSTQQKRYVLSGRVITGDEPANVINDMLSAMAGRVERVNGKWQIHAGVYSAPSETITESEMRERPDVSLNQPAANVVNEIRPIIRSALTSWEPSPGEGVFGIQRISITSVQTNPTNTFTKTAHGLTDADRIRFISWTGTAVDNDNLPSGITAGGWYYVVNATANTFQVSLTLGGSAVVLSTTGSGVVIEFDRFFTADGERITEDLVFKMVADETQARRLARIYLLQSRAEVSARVRLKLGTPYCSAFNLQVGDTLRWIDAHKDFWESTGSVTGKSVAADGTITSTAHGLSDADPIIIDTIDTSGWRANFPYYVVNSTTNDFQIALYRGGPALTPDATATIDYDTIQGKLFVVDQWHLVNQGGALGIDLDLVETTTDLYDWDNEYEVVPASRQSISVANPRVVTAPSGMAVTSGTNVLYLRQDGTVQSRAKIAWNETESGFVASGGYVDIEYQQSSTTTFTADAGTDTCTATAHGLSDNDIVRVKSSTTLPAGLSASTDYVVVGSTANTFQLANFFDGSAIDITDAGTGTHTVTSQETWTSAGDVDGTATEFYLTDVEDGVDYDFRIRFRNSFGSVSAWTYTEDHTVVGKTAAPGVPTSTGINVNTQSFIIDWTNPTDTDFAKVEVWAHTATTADPAADATLVGSSAGTSFIYDLGAANVTRYFYIRSVDTTGNASAFVYVGFDTTWFWGREAKQVTFPRSNKVLTTSYVEFDSNHRVYFNLATNDVFTVGRSAAWKFVNTGGVLDTVWIDLSLYDNTGTKITGIVSDAFQVAAGTTKYVDLDRVTTDYTVLANYDGAYVALEIKDTVGSSSLTAYAENVALYGQIK